VDRWHRGRGRFAKAWNPRRRREGTTASPAAEALGVSFAPPRVRRSAAPEQPETSSPEESVGPVVTAVARPEKPGADPSAKQPAASGATVASPANERLDESTATPTPEPAITPVTSARSTLDAPTSAPDDPTPMPAQASAPAPDEPAPLNDRPTESPRRIEHVKVLQARLSLLGFEPGSADGRYGPLTTDAVIRFQKAHDLPVDGVLGPLTEEALGVILLPPTGERCQRVKALKRQLAWLGLEPGPVDGCYGPLTTAAVTRVQAAHDLRVDGVVGRLTPDALATSASARAISDRIERVKALQRKLGALGFDPGPVDGRYGPQTTDAVKRFQQAHDLHADGIADSHTQHALQQSLLDQQG
jgi:peptidoglycan hydrolase-like protein with peptidoglycan-binding domain